MQLQSIAYFAIHFGDFETRYENKAQISPDSLYNILQHV